MAKTALSRPTNRLLVLKTVKTDRLKRRKRRLEIFTKRRSDLIPNLVETVKGYTKHESETLEKVIQARNKFVAAKTTEEEIKADGELSACLGRLMAVSESYPELKANQTMIKAMNTYTDVEDHIAAARRFYNSAVNELNNAVEIFPSSVVASWLGIKKQEFFQAEGYERKAINL